jgi:methylenetetrahydrofolate dehydrogenase (NADP+)/methenyltetrahydrofolate cyclohydrolase
MSARVLDGRQLAAQLRGSLSARCAALVERTGVVPRLAIVQFGTEGPAAIYTGSVARAARGVGIDPLVVIPDAAVGLDDLARRLRELDADPTVAGVVVAEPLPDHLPTGEVRELIGPAKDVDGATSRNVGLLARGEPSFVPATARAVMTILRANGIEVTGRRAVVIGRSAVVGRPVAALLVAADATVTVCHSRTRDLAGETRRAEILVSAAGVPGLVTADMVGPGCTVIDCGINATPEGVVGDVDYEAVQRVAGAITPVPGGVGPVTAMMLASQTLDAAERLSEAGGTAPAGLPSSVARARS